MGLLVILCEIVP